MAFVRDFFRRFFAHSRGNVTMITGFAVIPIAAAIGAGIDFGNAMTARYRLQDAADSAAIAGAQEPTGLLANQTTAADKAFKCNLAKPPATSTSALDCNQLDPRLVSATGALSMTTTSNITNATYTASAKVNTFVLGLVGINSMTVNATAKAAVSINAAEIAFVLDNTGSMADNNKMTQLKSSLDATLASLLDSNGKNSGNTKVALVPFDTQVALSNVAGMVNYTGNFTTVNAGYTCTGLTTAQCSAVTLNYPTLCNSLTSSYGSSVSASCASNVINYTRTSGSYYYVLSSTYVTNPNYNPSCWYYCQSHYIAAYRYAVYSLSGSTANQYGNSSSGSTGISYVAYYTPYSLGLSYYNSYSQYSGNITYGVPTAGGYGSGATTVYKDNNTITSNDDLLGVGTNNWSGCVIDRTQPYDVQADAPVSTNASTLYPAAKCATNSLLPIMDLTTDIAGARSYASKMTPAGNTNITIGIQWGMEVLSPSAPFTSGKGFTDKTVNKYMIVLTDGLNTQNRWTTNSSQIDARTALACANAKALGITVFTVRLEQGNSAMLAACASRSDYYYNLSNANQISGALGSIMKSIKKIRLTK